MGLRIWQDLAKTLLNKYMTYYTLSQLMFTFDALVIALTSYFIMNLALIVKVLYRFFHPGYSGLRQPWRLWELRHLWLHMCWESSSRCSARNRGLETPPPTSRASWRRKWFGRKEIVSCCTELGGRGLWCGRLQCDYTTWAWTHTAWVTWRARRWVRATSSSPAPVPDRLAAWTHSSLQRKMQVIEWIPKRGVRYPDAFSLCTHFL